MNPVRAVIAAAIAAASLLSSGDVADAYVLRGGKWGSPGPGTGATVTWSVMDGGIGTDEGLTVDPDSILQAGYRNEIGTAFSAWSAVADLTFVPTKDPGVDWLAAGASWTDIRIGFRPFDGALGNLGFAYFPASENGAGAGDIFLDSADWALSGGSGFDLMYVLVHEIGHAIGLDHAAQGTAMHEVYSANWRAPQPDDIAGARYLYGPPATVPLPPALPMLLGALAALGAVRLFGRWRG